MAVARSGSTAAMAISAPTATHAMRLCLACFPPCGRTPASLTPTGCSSNGRMGTGPWLTLRPRPRPRPPSREPTGISAASGDCCFPVAVQSSFCCRHTLGGALLTGLAACAQCQCTHFCRDSTCAAVHGENETEPGTKGRPAGCRCPEEAIPGTKTSIEDHLGWQFRFTDNK